MIGKSISHYKILEKLGEGGMGVVYKAEDIKLDRIVALKFLPPELTSDEEAKQRLTHEAQAASSLNHQNICSIHTIEEFEDRQIIDMEFVEGKTLSAWLKEKEFSLNEVIAIAVQIAEGLNAAHKKGIVHRDIKPDNIMLTEEGMVKIMDFGLAKAKGSPKLTKTHSTLGTLSYMSPEQARGEKVDQRSDIFSFGAVLYEMITHQRAFKGEHEAAILYSILNDTPDPLARYKANVPEELQRVIDKALAKEKDRRFQHMNEMAVDLQSVPSKASSSNIPKIRKLKMLWLSVIAFIIVVVIGLSLYYRTTSPIPIKRNSIAVLPFENMSDSKEDEYFADGLTEDIITQLSKIRGIDKVIARTSVMQYKGAKKRIHDVGRELGVARILEGSVRRSGNQVRITAQLINVENEGHLWADTYDKQMTEIFAIQSDVARRIADALKIELAPEEKERIDRKQTGNTEAYQLYLKGRYYWNKRQPDALNIAIEYFNHAIEKDPDYALAYAGLASAYVVQPSFTLPGDWYTLSQEAALKALEMDPMLSEAHTVLGELEQDRHFNLAGAEEHFKRAIELDPFYPTVHQWYSTTLYYLGRFSEALSEAKRAHELDPLSLIINMNLGDALYTMRRYESAIDQYQNTLALDENFPWAHQGLAIVYQVQRRFDESLAEIEKTKNLGGDLPYTHAFTGLIYAQSGRRSDASLVLEDLLKRVQQGSPVAYGIALIYYELGEKDKAFEWFEKSYRDREVWLLALGTDPLWDDLRSDPRFAQLLKKMGLKK